VKLPQVRDTEKPFRSELWRGMRKRTDVLEQLVLEMYVRGLSTRDIEDALREVGGDQPLLSRSSAGPVVYLLADASYESLREQAGFKEGLLATGPSSRTGARP